MLARHVEQIDSVRIEYSPRVRARFIVAHGVHQP
jgi:hypothetical protein